MGGLIAMDYTTLFMRMDRMSLASADWDALYEDIRVLESAAIEQSRKT